MGFADDLAADLTEAVGDYEQTFSWRGNSYPCVRTTEPAALMVAPGGLEEEVSERITVAYSVFGAGPTPAQGDMIDGNALQVQRADPNIGHVVLWVAPPMNFRDRG